MNKSHDEVWSNCLEIIRDIIPSASFKTWFEPIVPLRLEKNILTIQVPSPFFYEYLEEQYIDILRKTLRREIGNEAKLEYNIIMENSGYTNGKPYTVRYPSRNKSDLQNKPMQVPFEVTQPTIRNPFIIPGIKKLHLDPRLNPDYSFANFIEGECNRLARSAGIAVGNNPGGTAFNPLMIYGDSGLGKTHLVQAIGILVKEKFPDKTVLYVNANKFQTQFVESIRNNNKNDFLHFYQMIDVLIIDDVHEFAGKEKTQDTFFHVFNHLHQSGKQLILTCDKPPVELQGMEQRLLSRFKWGLLADLQKPDFETRLAILRKKAYNDGIELPDEIFEFLAENISSNIRELESGLISLYAQSTLNRKEVTLELARQMVDRLVNTQRKEITIDYIQKVVCEYYKIPVDQMQGKTRKREIVQARQVSMYFSKSLTKASLASIGSSIGGKDHATVLHACKTVNNLIDTDRHFRNQIIEIEKKLKV
ncbi:MAG: chromosomal replication initiator protein DnaA [Bacteroidales bacterium]|jgi:chromosomal replication initiator protein|nr:chromosomal replication initiator protein DnaA [Bacteroidales bacterium]